MVAWKSWTWTLSLGDGDAVLVGGAVDDAPLDAAASQPRGKGLVMMLAAQRIGLGVVGRAAELGGPHHEGRVEHAAAFQIANQAGNRPVDVLGQALRGRSCCRASPSCSTSRCRPVR